MFSKNPRYKNKAILQAARDEACTANFPGCNHDNSTSVFCHLNESFAGKGIGKKADDDAGFIGCSACHDLYDARRFLPSHLQEEWNLSKYFYLLRAVIRTRKVLRGKGIVN